MPQRLTKPERVLRVLRRQEVDYLPSQVVIADRARYEALSRALHLDGAEQLDDYLENHLYLTLLLQDKPLFYRDVREEINGLCSRGFCKPDWDNRVVYDAWGMGIRVDLGSFFSVFHPLARNATAQELSRMPDRLDGRTLSSGSLKERIEAYTTPDPHQPGNYDDWQRDLRERSEDFLVWPSGYFATFERTCHLVGFDQFMTLLIDDRPLLERLLDKVTDYRVEVAKKMVELGFPIAHYGDDLGTQRGGILSQRMFQEVLLPRIRRVWQVFTDAGLPIMLHSCGDVRGYLPQLIDIGLSVLEPCQPVMDLAYLKREYGKDLVFFGGINTQVLPFISPEQTRELARTTIRTLGRGGGYIIAPSQELMNDVPIENIQALVETIREERSRVLEMSGPSVP